MISPPGTDPPLQIEREVASPATTATTTTPSAELERLAELHARGVLSDDWIVLAEAGRAFDAS